MRLRGPALLSSLLCACAAPRASTDLEAQIRELRAEQTRNAQRVDQLETRVVLAEDSARQARQALIARGGPGAAVSISEDPLPAGATSARPVADPGERPAAAGGSEPAPAEDERRPVIQLHGGARGAPGLGPQERLPVVPLEGSSRRSGRSGTEPRDTGLGGHGTITPSTAPEEPPMPSSPPLPVPAAPQGTTPGVSSVRDPSALPAYDAALALARGQRCPEALEALSAFLVRWPDHPYASNAMYWRGECLLAGGDARRAAQEFEGMLARFPTANKVPDALFKLVQCYRRLGDAARARAFGDRLLREHADSASAQRLRAEAVAP